jgi:uncharacterized protein YnzC (UPF0291/DUF896 family)
VPLTVLSPIGELAAKANEGELTNEEEAEYEAYVQANQFIAILQSKARRLLQSTTKQ